MALIPTANPLNEAILAQDNCRYRENSEVIDSQSNYYFDQLINSMDQGYCIIDIVFDKNNKPCDYCFVDVNPAFEKQTGMSNVKGRYIKDIKPDHEQFWFDIYGQIALTGNPLRFQGWAAQLNRYYEVYAFRINEPANNKVAVLFNDVTIKKQAEANLAFLFDITKTLIDSSTPEEIIQTTGAKMGEYLGLSHFVFARIFKAKNKIEILQSWHSPQFPDISGTHMLSDYIIAGLKTIQPQGQSMVINNTQADPRVCKEIYKHLQVGSFITIPLKRDNEWDFIMCACRNEIKCWRSDEIKVVQEAALNIWTSLERQRIERDLIQSEERLRLAIETGKVGICDLDYKAGASYCNDVRYEMYGMSPSRNRTPVSEFFSRTHPDDVEALKKTVYRGIETAGRFGAEFRVVQPDGTIRWILENGRVTEWMEGEPQRIISTLIDITQRKTEEQQKDDFFKIASHELKSPVTNLKSVVYMLNEKLQEDNDSLVIELNNQLKRQTERLNRLISNMLDAARAAAGHLDYNMKRIHVVPLLQEAIEDLQNTTQLHKLKLTAVPLPAIHGDSMRLTQVFTNIISNAIKYTPSSARTEQKEIRIETHHVCDEIRITVTDNGIGMSAGTRKRLFERFFRSDTPETHHYSGLGLGLYISKEIVQKHGGDICVESEKGRGTTFTIVLPVK